MDGGPGGQQARLGAGTDDLCLWAGSRGLCAVAVGEATGGNAHSIVLPTAPDARHAVGHEAVLLLIFANCSDSPKLLFSGLSSVH